VPVRRRAPELRRRSLTGEQWNDLWIGAVLLSRSSDVRRRLVPMLSVSVAGGAGARVLVAPEERWHYVALYDYDERFREASEESAASERDIVLVEIERGLLEPTDLATLLSIGAVKVDPLLLERAEAARKALEAGA
jgi:hypothetical protein